MVERDLNSGMSLLLRGRSIYRPRGSAKTPVWQAEPFLTFLKSEGPLPRLNARSRLGQSFRLNLP